MGKATVLCAAISLCGMFGCASLNTHDRGGLIATKKTPMDGFFLMGNLNYVKNNLRVASYADNGTTATSKE